MGDLSHQLKRGGMPPPAAVRSTRLFATAALVTVVAIAAVAIVSVPPPRAARAPGASNDIENLDATAARMRSGEDFYAAHGGELRKRGYPIRHPFNWRTPLHLSTITSVPEVLAVAAWIALAAILVIMTGTVTFAETRTDPLVVVISTFMQVGFVLTLSPTAMTLMGEAWSGALLGISVLSYVANRRPLAIATGLAALFCRELAAPYCVVCTVMAARHRRWRELVAWVLGAAVYGAYYLIHIMQVRAHLLPTDAIHQSSWMRLEGLSFLLATVKWQFWLHFTPASVAALVLAVICAGIVHRKTPWMIKATALIYAIFFMIAGQAFNQYWGLMAWPVWAVACGFGTGALRDWTRDAVSPELHPRST
jgi:hypothetical protein